LAITNQVSKQITDRIAAIGIAPDQIKKETRHRMRPGFGRGDSSQGVVQRKSTFPVSGLSAAFSP
jgi:hypothetical protein